jgi:hypothetical protein
MKPNAKLISIDNNEKKIRELLHDLILAPRMSAIRWASVTRQTPNIKIGYPGQHLASLITGMTGESTGARGNDLCDGSEVKSCSRIDQLDKCSGCGEPVARVETRCSACGSGNIERKNDSKWLFTIRSEDDLKLLTEGVDRIVLLLGDYPNFDDGDYSTLRFQAFEIWPKSPRQARFRELMRNYYHNIYLEHRKGNPNKTPAPKNFWPYSYQFYICNPIQTCLGIVRDADTSPKIEIRRLVPPEADRSMIDSELMPVDLLSKEELRDLVHTAPAHELESAPVSKDIVESSRELRQDRAQYITHLTEELRARLPLRDTDRIATAKAPYVRRQR